MFVNNFYTLLFLAWLVFVTFCSLFPFSDSHTTSFIRFPHFDKVVHFVFYFVFCIIGVLCIREKTKGKMNLVRALATACIATIIIGAFIEVLQHTVSIERMADAFDALANSLGSLCGALVMKFLFLEKRQLKWKY